MPRPCNDYSCYGALEIVGAITITITVSTWSLAIIIRIHIQIERWLKVFLNIQRNSECTKLYPWHRLTFKKLVLDSSTSLLRQILAEKTGTPVKFYLFICPEFIQFVSEDVDNYLHLSQKTIPYLNYSTLEKYWRRIYSAWSVIFYT